MALGKFLKDILKDQKMTIKELAERSGISSYTLYGITRRDSLNVHEKTLKKIGDALNMPDLPSIYKEEMLSITPTSAGESVSARAESIWKEICQNYDPEVESIPDESGEKLTIKALIELLLEFGYDLEADLVPYGNGDNYKPELRLIYPDKRGQVINLSDLKKLTSEVSQYLNYLLSRLIDNENTE